MVAPLTTVLPGPARISGLLSAANGMGDDTH